MTRKSSKYIIQPSCDVCKKEIVEQIDFTVFDKRNGNLLDRAECMLDYLTIHSNHRKYLEKGLAGNMLDLYLSNEDFSSVACKTLDYIEKTEPDFFRGLSSHEVRILGKWSDIVFQGGDRAWRLGPRVFQRKNGIIRIIGARGDREKLAKYLVEGGK